MAAGGCDHGMGDDDMIYVSFLHMYIYIYIGYI